MSLYQNINQAASSHRVEEAPERYRARPKPLLLRDTESADWRMSHTVAEQLAGVGLDPDYLTELAAAAALDPKELFDFAGIDRTTVGRRKAAGSPLPHDVGVKALEATELVTLANQAFGTPAAAAEWLTSAHPLLDGQTPLRRARTPWGLTKVQSLLVALRFGGVA